MFQRAVSERRWRNCFASVARLRNSRNVANTGVGANPHTLRVGASDSWDETEQPKNVGLDGNGREKRKPQCCTRLLRVSKLVDFSQLVGAKLCWL